jgi:hypothetical protein
VNNIFSDKSNKISFLEENASVGHKDSVGVNLDVSHQNFDDRVDFFSRAYETKLCVREFNFSFSVALFIC